MINDTRTYTTDTTKIIISPTVIINAEVDCPYSKCKSRGTYKCEKCKKNADRDYYEPVNPPYYSPYRFDPEPWWVKPVVTCRWTQ